MGLLSNAGDDVDLQTLSEQGSGSGIFLRFRAKLREDRLPKTTLSLF